ncbi:hypothetical protein OH492_14205 [Vibrio chagasii]|nr:hypothetical protein [Vibrio chagasii]
MLPFGHGSRHGVFRLSRSVLVADAAYCWAALGWYRLPSIWRTATAVAIVLLSRFVDPSIIMIRGRSLLQKGVHFGALEAAQPGWARTRKFSALLPLGYGLILFVGYFPGNSDPLNPLANRESAQPMAITSLRKPIQSLT